MYVMMSNAIIQNNSPVYISRFLCIICTVFWLQNFLQDFPAYKVMLCLALPCLALPVAQCYGRVISREDWLTALCYGSEVDARH